MFRIRDDNTIILTQGNSAIINVIPYIDDESEPIVLSTDEKIYFTIKSPSGRVYMQKVLTLNDYDEENNLNLIFKPEDTINLEVYDYLYDMLYVNKDGDAYTFIESVPIFSTDKMCKLKCICNPKSTKYKKSYAATFRVVEAISKKDWSEN